VHQHGVVFIGGVECASSVAKLSVRPVIRKSQLAWRGDFILLKFSRSSWLYITRTYAFQTHENT